MSRFRKLSHTILYCQYHLIWVPKDRYRVSTGVVGGQIGLDEEMIRKYVKFEEGKEPHDEQLRPKY